MILTSILQGQKYGIVQAVSRISRDFLFLAIKLNRSDGLSSKNDMLKVAFVFQNVQSFKKFTEWNARKSTVNIAFFGYGDVIIIRKKPMFSCEYAQITETCTTRARRVKKL